MRFFPLALLALAGVAVVGAGANGRAQPSAPVEVTVSLQELALPSRRVEEGAINGFNFGNMMLVVGFERDFSRLNLRALRFPPGNQADEVALTQDVVRALKVNWQLLGEPDLLVIANLFQGSPAEAAAAARTFRGAGMPVQAWSIGNEPDLYASNRNDPSWTPAKYCARFRAFAAALKEVDSSYRMVGPSVSGSRPSGEAFLREVVRRCGDAIDVLSWHIYPTDGTFSDKAALATVASVSQEINRYRAWLRGAETNPLGQARETELAVTEFGLSWRTNNYHHLEDMTAALWLASALGQMATEGLAESYYFALQGLGGHGLIDVSGWLRPTYYVYEMLASFRGEVLPVTLNAPAPDTLDAYAARDNEVLRLLLGSRPAA